MHQKRVERAVKKAAATSKMIQNALRKCGGRLEETATMLGISRKGLYLKRLRYGLIEPGEQAAEEVEVPQAVEVTQAGEVPEVGEVAHAGEVT